MINYLKNRIMDKKFKKLLDNMSSKIHELNSSTMCFLGDKPKKLPWKINEMDESCNILKTKLKNLIEFYILSGYNTFISDLAIGFNIICAEIVISLKLDYPHITLIGALPYKNQESGWTKLEKMRYYNVLKNTDKIRCIYETYPDSKHLNENKSYMINNSSLIITFYDGKTSEIDSAIKYAKKQGIKIISLKL